MFKKILIITTVVFLLLIATIIILHWQTDIISDLSKDVLNTSLGDIAQLDYSSLSGDLLKNMILKDLRITFTNGIQIKSNYLKFRYSLDETIAGRYIFDFIRFDSLSITIPSSDTSSDSVDTSSDESLQQTLNHFASSIPLKD